MLTGVADPPVDFAAEGWFPGEAIIQWKETAPYTIPINVPPPIPDSSRLTVAAGRAGHCVIACQAPVSASHARCDLETCAHSQSAEARLAPGE